MNLPELEKKLMGAAKAMPLSDAVPYGFEQRIMRRLAEKPAPDPWAFLAGVLWRFALPCLGAVLLLGAWAITSGAVGERGSSLSTELESAAFASADTSHDLW